MNYERPYYEDINYHPLMFYVVFGAKEEELEISRERHNIDEIPEGLNINMLIREQHGEYMDNLIGGTLGKILKEEQPELYEKIQKENIWAVINGEIMQDDNLKYLRNTIGIVQAFLDTGAIAVLDMQTFSLYSAEEFTEKIFSKDLDMDNHKAQNGIIVIDEIDKKAGHEVSHDVAGTEVLKSLLKIIEGTTIKVPVEMDYYNVKLADFDTKNIIIIFLGAFSGLDIIRDKRLNSNPLGFSIKEETHKSKAKFLKQDLVKYGLPEEFVGRIDTIVEMNELTKKDLALILKKSELSIFKRYQNELSNMGITLIYNDDLFESIAEKSLVLDTGARELSNTVNYMFENIVFDVLSNPNKYKKCILDSEIAQDNTKYTLS